MGKPTTRLDTKELRKTLREIANTAEANYQRNRHKRRILNWYDRRKVEDACHFLESSKSWFYRLYTPSSTTASKVI